MRPRPSQEVLLGQLRGVDGITRAREGVEDLIANAQGAPVSDCSGRFGVGDGTQGCTARSGWSLSVTLVDDVSDQSRRASRTWPARAGVA